MPIRQAPPAESDLLCEFCGYILNGLAPGAQQCPECGEPLAPSLNADARRPSPVEVAWTARTFWKTTWLVIARKRRFFRETLTRVVSENVSRFGKTHRLIAGAMFGAAATFHLAYMAETRLWLTKWSTPDLGALVIAGLALVSACIFALHWVTRIAIWMTNTEGKFWGMRLPAGALVRAMNFHAANYLPVAILALAVTAGYRVLYALDVITPVAGVPYLLTLSGLVVASAIWLFESYVIAMRRIRYANF